MHIPVYGEEHTFLDKETGLLYRNSSFQETASLHTHNFFEFFIVTDGTALHMVNDTLLTLAKGDLVFIRPRDTHSYQFYYSEDFRIINVGFSQLIFQNIKNFLGSSEALQQLTEEELPPCIHTDSDASEDIIRDFKKIGALMKTGIALYATLHAQCCLAGIFVDYFFRYSNSAKRNGQRPLWFDEMLADMDKIENLQLGLPRMLKLAACSKNHLCRVFKSFLGLTPTDYINDKRLEYAVYYLTQTRDDIVEISEHCGFNNLSHFYHLFKKKYHCSPARFRKTHFQ